MPVRLPFAAWRAMSPREATREFTRRVAALPPALRSAALAWADSKETLERAFAAADTSAPLRGLPCLAKDLYDVAGVPTRGGSSFLAEVRPVRSDSALIGRLRELGAAIAGKTHLVEFAAGLTGENRTYGDCPHPEAPGRLSGGSSSGSAALVAAGVAPFALGTDTGGSVRVPAAFCGVFGYRGAPGDAFIRDAFPLSPTCDTAGWFTANPADMETLLDALVGPGEPSAAAPRGVYLRATDLVAESPLDETCARAAATLASPADALTREALLRDWSEAVDAYATIVMREANHIHRDWLAPWRERYDPTIWQRIHDAGSFSSEKIAAARRTAERIRAGFAQYFQSYDFLVLPCAPLVAPTKAECTPETRLRILRCTTPASLAGLPCLTVPVALEGGLTAGLQIIVPRPTSPVLRWVLRQG